MGNWLGINAKYDPPYTLIEGRCRSFAEALNNPKSDEEFSKAATAHQKCLEMGYETYNSELAKTQNKIDLVVMGGFVLVAVVVLVIIAQQWGRITATFRQFHIDFEASKIMRAKDRERDKADFAQKVQERLNDLEKQREG